MYPRTALLLGLAAGMVHALAEPQGARLVSRSRDVAWLPVRSPVGFDWPGQTDLEPAPETAFSEPLVFSHPLERLANVSGEGNLRVLEDGTVLIAVELSAPGTDGTAGGRILRMLPADPASTTMLPDASGEIRVRYSAREEMATVHVNGELFVYFTLRQEKLGRTDTSDAAPVVRAGVGLSAHRLSAEATGELPIRLIEAVGDGLLPAESLAGVTDWRAAVFELEQLVDAEGPCKACQAGGPGSSGCGIHCPGGNPDDCAVSCTSGYYACCKCIGGNASCMCCANP